MSSSTYVVNMHIMFKISLLAIFFKFDRLLIHLMKKSFIHLRSHGDCLSSSSSYQDSPNFGWTTQLKDLKNHLMILEQHDASTDVTTSTSNAY